MSVCKCVSMIWHDRKVKVKLLNILFALSLQDSIYLVWWSVGHGSIMFAKDFLSTSSLHLTVIVIVVPYLTIECISIFWISYLFPSTFKNNVITCHFVKLLICDYRVVSRHPGWETLPCGPVGSPPPSTRSSTPSST